MTRGERHWRICACAVFVWDEPLGLCCYGVRRVMFTLTTIAAFQLALVTFQNGTCGGLTLGCGSHLQNTVAEAAAAHHASHHTNIKPKTFDKILITQTLYASRRP